MFPPLRAGIGLSALLTLATAPSPAATLCGHVTDRDTGLPVSGAGVFVYVSGGAFTDRYATTDELGAFCVDSLQAGTYDLCVLVDDYLPRWVRDIVLDEEVSVEVPFDAMLRLAAPRPNPARHQVTISFRVPPGEPVSVTIHDARGRLVRGWEGSGGPERSITWDFTDREGRPVPAGFYFVRLDADGRRLVRPVVCLR